MAQDVGSHRRAGGESTCILESPNITILERVGHKEERKFNSEINDGLDFGGRKTRRTVWEFGG